MANEHVGEWRVDILESESGWGSRIDESKYFPTKLDANAFVEKYNSTYNPKLEKGQSVPDWYMIACEPVLEK